MVQQNYFLICIQQNFRFSQQNHSFHVIIITRETNNNLKIINFKNHYI